jgi:hypothetical protein
LLPFDKDKPLVFVEESDDSREWGWNGAAKKRLRFGWYAPYFLGATVRARLAGVSGAACNQREAYKQRQYIQSRHCDTQHADAGEF